MGRERGAEYDGLQQPCSRGPCQSRAWLAPEQAVGGHDAGGDEDHGEDADVGVAFEGAEEVEEVDQGDGKEPDDGGGPQQDVPIVLPKPPNWLTGR